MTAREVAFSRKHNLADSAYVRAALLSQNLPMILLLGQVLTLSA